MATTSSPPPFDDRAHPTVPASFDLSDELDAPDPI